MYKGSGLGLYAVKQYVESLQGQIQVTSQVGQGSCFTVTVPLVVASRHSAATADGDRASSKASGGEANAHQQSQIQTTKVPSAKKSLTAHRNPSQSSSTGTSNPAAVTRRQDLGRQAATSDKQAVADPSDDLSADLSAEALAQEEAQRAQTEALAKAEASAKTNSPRATVLVVEDNAMAAMGIQTKLKQLYCAVDLAPNGTQAVQMAQSKRYDVIFTDIGLPDKNGIEMTQILRRRIGTKIPIVALTGHADDPKWQKACLDAGMQAVLSKPAKLPELESVLETVVLSGEGGKPSSQAPSVADTPGLEVIDWAACVALYDGNETGVREMLAILANDLKTTQSVLAKAYANRDTEALMAELHRLRGGVSYLKLPELEFCLKAFHEAVKADPQDATRLESTYEALQQAIKRFWTVWETR